MVGRKSLGLPAHGFRYPDGTPLFHKNRRSLTLKEEERLKNCGVVIFKGPFSHIEDDTIRLNWIRYASEENIDFKRAFEFAGGYASMLKRDGVYQKLLAFQNKSAFLPRICKGLENRTARQITERMRRIFHPSGEYSYSGSRAWSKKEIDKLKNFVERGFTSSEIAIKMSRTKSAVEYKASIHCGIKKSTMRYKPNRKAEYDNGNIFAADNADHCCGNNDVINTWLTTTRKRIIDYTNNMLHQRSVVDEKIQAIKLELFEETGGCDIVHLAMSEQREKFLDAIDYDELSKDFGKPGKSLRRKWRHVLKKIQEVCVDCNGDAVKTFFYLYGKKYVKRLISLSEFFSILKLLLEQEGIRRNCIDKDFLQRRIEEEKITGFYTKGLSEADLVTERIKKYLSRNKCKFADLEPESRSFDIMDWIFCIMKALEEEMIQNPELEERENCRFKIPFSHVLKYVRLQIPVAASRGVNRRECFYHKAKSLVGEKEVDADVLDFC